MSVPRKINAAQCKKCGDVIRSHHRHDFVRCCCGEIFIDGGEEYWRCGANDFDNFIRLDADEYEALKNVRN